MGSRPVGAQCVRKAAESSPRSPETGTALWNCFQPRLRTLDNRNLSRRHRTVVNSFMLGGDPRGALPLACEKSKARLPISCRRGYHDTRFGERRPVLVHRLGVRPKTPARPHQSDHPQRALATLLQCLSGERAGVLPHDPQLPPQPHVP